MLDCSCHLLGNTCYLHSSSLFKYKSKSTSSLNIKLSIKYCQLKSTPLVPLINQESHLYIILLIELIKSILIKKYIYLYAYIYFSYFYDVTLVVLCLKPNDNDYFQTTNEDEIKIKIVKALIKI